MAKPRIIKPTIFFSHSTRDEVVLNKLKDTIITKTGGTIDIFLSSDGQSIPLGRNWVHRIEESLKDTKIMFVFISPNSITSNWLYFEAGYAYSRGIRVIPVAILGVDLNQVRPPLSLLQGFNLQSADSLNNILAILNEEFQYSHSNFFASQDFSIIFETDSPSKVVGFGSLNNFIGHIELDVRYFSPKAHKMVTQFLNQNDLKHEDGHAHEQIFSHGIRITDIKERNSFEVSLDPLASEKYFDFFSKMARAICSEAILLTFQLTVYLSEDVRCINNFLNQSARLSEFEIIRLPERFKFNGMNISIDTATRPMNVASYISNPAYVTYEMPVECLEIDRIRNVIEILFKAGVLYLKNTNQ